LGIQVERQERQAGSNPPGEAQIKPRWERTTKRLFLGVLVIRQYKRKAWSQFAILDALEREGWPNTGVAAPSILGVKNAVEGICKGLLTTPLRISATAGYAHIDWQLDPSA
jgi:hypothetical protein